MVISSDKKQVKWDGKYLYLRVNGTERKLGKINTRKGALTRAQKLKAVAHTNEWVEL